MMRSGCRRWGATLAMAAISAAATIWGASRVAAAGSESVTFPGAGSSQTVFLSGSLSRPATTGRAPAVVLLHGCSGIQEFERGYGPWLASQGYAALLVDSLGPRGKHDVCTGGTPGFHDRALDALGALAYLRTRPDIDPARIAVLGWSHGGGAAIEANTKTLATEAKLPGGGFRAAIGLYAACRELRLKTQGSPLLLLLGGADDWTPAGNCEDLAQQLVANGYSVTVQEYPGATHAFDNPIGLGRIRVGGKTVTLEYDSSASTDARQRILNFLSANVR
jgi:dienelactone hydrolase